MEKESIVLDSVQVRKRLQQPDLNKFSNFRMHPELNIFKKPNNAEQTFMIWTRGVRSQKV